MESRNERKRAEGALLESRRRASASCTPTSALCHRQMPRSPALSHSVNNSPIPFFRAVAKAEAMSFQMPLGVAMPLKYLAGWSLAVKIVGALHGWLFISFPKLAQRFGNEIQRFPPRLRLPFGERRPAAPSLRSPARATETEFRLTRPFPKRSANPSSAVH